MKYFNNRTFKIIFVIAMLAVMLLAVTSCEDMFPTSSAPQETPEPEPVETTTATKVNTRDSARLAV